MPEKLITFAVFCVLLLLPSAIYAQELADPHFDVRVANPAFTKNYPRVLFDEAHNNNETTSGRYKPFANLLFDDGYHLAINRQPFTKQTLANAKILIIVDPLGSEDVDDDTAANAAFTEAECDAVFEWVRGGGALLLVLDKSPFASAAENLAKRLGIEMSKTETADAKNTAAEFGRPDLIVYSRENKTLGDHPITNGREQTERVNRVIVFGGQSLKGPADSETFLKLSETAVDNGKGSAAGRAQGLAIRVGRGRVVAFADAAMLSAQLTGSDSRPFGMNVPDVDNRQLTLNVMHWLSGLLK